MAWLAIPGNPNWEYSNAPNTDKPANDTYDYDANANHTAGIRTNNSGPDTYVLCRQIESPGVRKPNGGYGELNVA